MSIGAYVRLIDRLLAGARPLFADHVGGSTGPGEPRGGLLPPDAESAVRIAVARAGTAFQADRSRAESATSAAADMVASYQAHSEQAGATAAGIRHLAAAQAAAIAPPQTTVPPEAVVLLVRTMDERLAQVQDHLTASRAALNDGAAQLRRYAGDLAALRPE